jgi:hypothetical protein
MSFNHTRVDFIEKTTKTLITQLAEDVHSMDANDPPIVTVDGVPVKPELANYCAEIRKLNRHVKFGVGRRMKYDHRNKVNLLEELYAYMDGHTYALMKIGFADYSLRSNDTRKYMVYARMIRNDKFKEDRENYYMATAESMVRALKNVKKYMRPYSPVECAEMSFDDVRSKFSSVGYGVQSMLTGARNSVVDSSHVRNELFHMLDIGYEFLSEDFRDKIAAWRQAYRENQEAQARALHTYYVNVRIHREEMVCDVIEVLDANKRSRLEATAPVTTYKMEELPEHIAGNLAALSMVDNNHYVDGVGLRVDSTTFWVQK